MGISHINGFELNAGLSTYTVNGANAAASVHDRAWVGYTTTQDPGNQNSGQLVNISTNDTEAARVDGAIPVGGGKCALALNAAPDEWTEFLSPPNLLSGGHDAASAFHGAGVNGLKRMGFRFFWRAPEAFEQGTDQLCRFYDGDLERAFSDAAGNKLEQGPPLFRLSFKNDESNDPSKAGLFVKNYNNTQTLGQTTQSCFNVSTSGIGGSASWHQIAITVVVGGAPGENPQDSDGLIIINVDGVDVITITDTAIEYPGGVEAAQAIKYYSLLTSNSPGQGANSGSDIRVLFDNIVVYDHWVPGPNSPDFSPLQDAINSAKDLNQVIQAVFPVNLTEAGDDNSNDWGNWTAPDGGAPSGTAHLAIQGDDGFTSNNAPEDPIPYAEGTYLKTNDAGPEAAYSVDTWDRGMVHTDWGSNINEIRAIRVINVCKLKQVGDETALLTFKAPKDANTVADGANSMSKSLTGTDFQIVSATWDHNPDGNGKGAPGPLTNDGGADKTYVLDSMRIGLKINA